MRKGNLLFTTIVIMTLVLSCNQSKEKQQQESIGLDLTLVDSTTAPTHNFYQFVNGKWFDKTEIPAEYSSWGTGHELNKKNQEVLKFVLAEATKGEIYAENSNEIKAANYYASGMDSIGIENKNTETLDIYIDEIDAVDSKEKLQTVIAKLHVYGVPVLFGEGVSIDRKKSDQYAMGMGPTGLGLPDRDYYFKEDAKSLEIIAGYKAFVTNLFQFLGVDSTVAIAKAEKIYGFEKKLAASSMTRLERRNLEKTYNKMAIADLSKLSKSFDWDSFFNSINAANLDSVIISQTKYMEDMDGAIASTDLETIKDYIKIRLISNKSSYMPNRFVMASFNFYSKQLNGTEKLRERQKRIISNTNSNLGDALSKLYVNEVFPPEAKASALEMVNNIKEALKIRIEKLDWMAEDTKFQAYKKINTLKVKIGYPDEWIDYTNVDISKTDYLQNHLNVQEFEHNRNMAKLGQPIDKKEWFMPASIVNAYYYPPANEIVFPAGILQAPFYDYKVDDALNYGAIGAVIGHEITHGFDDRGSKFDFEGNQKDWWTEEDATNFEERSEVLVKQFDGLAIQDSLNVNGKLTLGENIADLAGLNIAYDALQIKFKKNGRPEDIDGLTAEQRFFMSFATAWRKKTRPERERQLLIVDPHAPSNFRGIEPLKNLPEFYEAFGVKEGDEMWKPDSLRVKIW